jgi:four helix bundle protein
MGESILKNKSFDFALAIVQTYKYLNSLGEYVMSKQLLRSGTSIGANIAEANMAQSTADFSAKMFIAQKEASETRYWLELLYRSGYITQASAQELLAQCVELINMLVATTKKTSPRLHGQHA